MTPDLTPDLFGEIDPPQRLLMGPGPVNAHPRVLRAMCSRRCALAAVLRA